MKIEIGDIIRVTQHAYINDDVYSPCVAVQGSTAEVVSISTTEAPGEVRYYVKFLTVEPYTPTNRYDYNVCEVGKIDWLDEEFIEVISKKPKSE